ncbi:hypothetical protein ACFQZE_08715 [Paenibacillus sp. GCM10027627]
MSKEKPIMVDPLGPAGPVAHAAYLIELLEIDPFSGQVWREDCLLYMGKA